MTPGRPGRRGEPLLRGRGARSLELRGAARRCARRRRGALRRPTPERGGPRVRHAVAPVPARPHALVRRAVSPSSTGRRSQALTSSRTTTTATFVTRSPPLLALYALDRANATIYLGTFSKSIGAALRLGYVVFPSALAGAAIGAKALLDNGHPWLEQAAVAEFLNSGGFERHLHRIRRRYLARRDCLLHELRRHFGRCRVDGAEGGMHVAWHLPVGAAPAPVLQRRLADDGVGVYSLAAAPVHIVEPVECQRLRAPSRLPLPLRRADIERGRAHCQGARPARRQGPRR